MTYERICPGLFIDRPNRFIANVEIEGETQVCHVKNTGRCKELFVPGARVFVQAANNPLRKTGYDLIGVEKGNQLINVDSAAPNKVFMEYLRSGRLVEGITLIRPETKYGTSRFDFYVEAGERRMFIETKGVTLEEEGVARFPDAPTQRGVRHLQELCRCVSQGYEALAVFVLQMKGIRYFTPNDRTHPAFGDALREARQSGVKVLALDCRVGPDSLDVANAVEVRL